MEIARDGFWLATSTIALTAFLECFSLGTVRNVLTQEGGRELYLTSLSVNFLNHYILGIPVYVVGAYLFCSPAQEQPSSDNLLGACIRAAASTFKILALCWFHGCLYWYVHKSMHLSPALYKFHKFHHRFHKHVPPSSANAVSVVEYLVAYVTPFAVAAFLTRATVAELKLSVALTSVANLALHTPFLVKVWPLVDLPIFVSTEAHMDHHERSRTNYSAPIWNFDWMQDKLYAAAEEDAEFWLLNKKAQ